MNRFPYVLLVFAVLLLVLLIIIPRLIITPGLIAPAQAGSNASTNEPTTMTLWRRSIDRKIECLESRIDELDQRFPPAQPPRPIEIVEPPAQKDD